MELEADNQAVLLAAKRPGKTDGQERGANHKHPRAAWPAVSNLVRGRMLCRDGCCLHQVCKTAAGLKWAPENSLKIYAFQSCLLFLVS